MKTIINILFILLFFTKCTEPSENKKKENLNKKTIQFDIIYDDPSNPDSKLVKEKIKQTIGYLGILEKDYLIDVIENNILSIEISPNVKESILTKVLTSNYRLSFAPITEIETEVIEEIKNNIKQVSLDLCDESSSMAGINLGCYSTADTSTITNKLNKNFEFEFRWSLFKVYLEDAHYILPVQFGISEFEKLNNSNILSIKKVDSEIYSSIHLVIDNELLEVLNNNLNKSIALLINDKIIISPSVPSDFFYKWKYYN